MKRCLLKNDRSLDICKLKKRLSTFRIDKRDNRNESIWVGYIMIQSKSIENSTILITGGTGSFGVLYRTSLQE